jgi:hypothetical protein
MDKRKELHKKIIEITLQKSEVTLRMKESILGQRTAINELLKIALNCFKDEKISEALFNLNTEQISIGTRALLYSDLAIKHLEKNFKKSEIYLKKMDDEMKKFFEISDQVLKAPLL